LNAELLKLKVLLDEGVPISVGEVCAKRGYDVLYFGDVLIPGSKDEVVCEAALKNEAILIAIDGDMKIYARKYTSSLNGDRFKNLHVIRLVCNEVIASKRIEQAFDLLELEWRFATALAARRMWVDIQKERIQTHR
jgi:predicted nuclease of predicted toxin-antitoxin system